MAARAGAAAALPLDISERVAKDHLARAVKEIARRFDLAAIKRQDSPARQQRAFASRMMILLCSTA